MFSIPDMVADWACLDSSLLVYEIFWEVKLHSIYVCINP